MLTYRDPQDGSVRLKRRYSYALWAFSLGLIAGSVLTVIIIS